MNTAVKCPFVHSRKTVRRVFLRRNIEIFNNRLQNEIWEDVYIQKDVTRAYNSFLTKYLKYFVNISPKKISKNKDNKSGWLMKGIKVSGQRLDCYVCSYLTGRTQFVEITAIR
jgi:hypothetical protein